MSQVLAYNPENLEKSKGEWQTNIGNFLADITLTKSNKVFQSRENKSIDICILNHGGIRTMIPKGNVTARNAFEVMPFENNFVVLDCDYENAQKLFYKISQSGGWPISSGSSITIKDSIPTEIIINGQKIEKNKIYKIGLPDYIANGGDDCHFLKTVKRIDTGLLIRDMLINYVRDKKNIVANNEKRITVLK